MPYKWPIEKGVLHLGGVSVEQIAKKFDTPCYVTDAAVIQERFSQLHDALKPFVPFRIAYACKANTNLSIVKLLAAEGCGIDAVSPGEVAAALKAGVKPADIMFTGTNPRDDELKWLVSQGVYINIDAVSVARRVAPLCKPRGFSVRINPGVGAGHHEHVVTGSEGTKFGVREDELPAILDLLKQHGHRLERLHAHIGSGIMDAAPYCMLIDELGRIARDIASHPAVKIDTVDIGGGLGIPYEPGEKPIDIADVIGAIGKHFRKWFGNHVALMTEPGRFLVAESTVLLARVTTIKTTGHITFAGIDAGFNTLARPILYGAYHHIDAATKIGQKATANYTICGPICETGDIIAHNRTLPKLEEGDLLAIFDTGAYGFSMASTYNSRPRPAEVMVSDGAAHGIRRRETAEDLFTTCSTF